MFSWRRSGSIFHPHFMFSSMLLVFASDFMIRGYDDANLDLIPLSTLYGYQLATLLVMIGVGVATAFIRAPFELPFRDGVLSLHRITQRNNSVILICSATILLLEIVKRLSATGWSVGEVLDQTFAARGFRDWDVEGDIGRNNAVFQLISAMLPVASISAAYVLFWGNLGRRLIAAALYMLGMFILITDGSRTPAVISIAAIALFGMSRTRLALARFAIVTICAVAIAATTSLMLLYRGSGFHQSLYEGNQFTFLYHQDDSIYRLWSSYYFADTSAYRWDPLTFFGFILSLPVPRKLWEAKPLLDQDFYGGFKLYYVTTTFMGELIAMFGSFFGTVVSFGFAMVVYRLLYSAQQLLRLPMGLAAYLLIAIYVYMVMRSMPNLTAFIFAPGAGLLLVWLVQRFGHGQGRPRPRGSARG